MSRRNRARFLTPCAMALAIASASSGQMGQGGLAPADTTPAAPVIPAAPAMPVVQADENWAAGLVVGSRLTYRSASATVFGELQKFEGGFPATGGSAQSITQATVVALRPDRAVFDFRNWLANPDGSGFSSTPTIPLVATPTQGVEVWRSPAELAKTPDGEVKNQAGTHTVRRLDHTVGGRTYRAVRISDLTQSERSWRTYDLETGVLISYSLAAVVKQRRQGEPDLMLVQQEFVDRRDMKLPYAVKPVPPELQKKTIRMTGQMSSHMEANQGMQPPPMPLNLTLTVEKFADEMLLIKGEGTPTAMPYLASAYYLDPQVLATLQAGMEIDRDPHLKSRLYVAEVANGRVTICDEGPAERFESSYDARTGLLVAGRKETRVAGMTTTIEFTTQYAD